ncbi:aluminum resistance protein [Clostridium sp. CAG:780]|jgi:aluminum resistance protein|nr:aluminum resistance protein [Clostridium sp. CAG:780]
MNKIIELVDKCEKDVEKEFKKAEKICEYNSNKVLKAFQDNGVSEVDFGSTTGYGYGDIGREKIEKVFAQVLGAEDCLVRTQFISGTHALTVALFAFLRPGDTMLSINGKPYDTLDEVIGITENKSSLKSFGVNYEQIELVDNDFDYEKIQERLQKSKVKLIEIQRSKGYAIRESITLDKVERVIKAIREIDQEVIIMIDNCYCEFVGTREPLEVGADVIVGSLIKNLGGGMAPNGAYIAGRKDLVELAAERLTVPGEGREVGPTLGINRQFLLGLFLAPSVVKASIKTAILTSKVLEELGYEVMPKYNDQRADIVQTIKFCDREKLILYCQGIQKGSPIDSNVLAEPSDMPGYDDQVIMASGSFTQGSSIELSCDAPLREPYVAFQQGALTYEYGKLGLVQALTYCIEKDENFFLNK